MYRIFFILVFFALTTFQAVGIPDKIIDSLQNVVQTSKEDTVLLKAHMELCRKVRNSDASAAVEHGKLAMALAIKLGRNKELAKIYNNLGTAYGNMGSRLKGYEYYKKAYELHVVNKEKVFAFVAWYNIGLMKSEEGKLTEAMQYYVDSKKVFEEAKDSIQLVLPIMGIGALYAKLGKYNDALESFLLARKLIEKQGDKRKLSTCLNNLASTYSYLEDHEKSVEVFKEAMYLHGEMGNIDGVAMCMYNLSSPLIKLKRYQDAIELLDSAIAITTSRNNRSDQAICYLNKSSVLMEMGKPEKALEYLSQALDIATDIDHGALISACYDSYHEHYIRLNDHKKALEYYKLHKKMQDSLVNQQLEGVNEIEKEYDREMKDREIEFITKEKEFEEYRSGTIRIIGAVALLALLIIVFVMFQRNRIRKQANKQLSEMNFLITEKNKDITDSISYASRIQDAILSSKESKSKIFPGSFVMFIPRDVVSGDFYWFAEKNGRKIMAAVDCTGHGVPGAFMSMIGNAFLNNIILENGITAPDAILNKLRERVVTALKQSDSGDGSRDGMDASICVFDSNMSKLSYAGANNPLWIARRGRQEMITLAADKQPIGLSGKNDIPFTSHSFELEKGDMIYLFTDGFPDQFGGEHNKKFTYKRFRELLLGLCFLDPAEQERELREKLSSWKGLTEQTDDILVTGIRV